MKRPRNTKADVVAAARRLGVAFGASVITKVQHGNSTYNIATVITYTWRSWTGVACHESITIHGTKGDVVRALVAAEKAVVIAATINDRGVRNHA